MTELVDLDMVAMRLAKAVGWSSHQVNTTRWDADLDDIIVSIINKYEIAVQYRKELDHVRRILVAANGEATTEAAMRVVEERNRLRAIQAQDYIREEYERGYAEATKELAPYLHEEKP